MPEPVPLGLRIAAACQLRGLTLRQLAAKIGRCPTTPRKWVVRGGPSHRVMQEIADCLEMSVAQIHATEPLAEEETRSPSRTARMNKKKAA